MTGEVDRFDWLRGADGLERLTLNASSVADLRNLPSSVRHLAIFNHGTIDVTHLPVELVSLRLISSEITGAQRISELTALKRLEIEGPSPISLGELPGALRELTLSKTLIDPVRLRLPQSLRSLTLQGRIFKSLGVLPHRVSSLELRETRVRHLRDLPSSLRTLRLQDNVSLDVSTLPRLLARLTLDRQGTVQHAWIPPYLKILRLIDTELEAANSVFLPASLEELRVDAALDLDTALRSLPYLRVLDADGRRIAGLGELPARLRRLILYAPPAPLTIPPGLEELELYAIHAGSLDLRAGPQNHLRRLGLKMSRLEARTISSALETFPRVEALSLSQSRLARMPDLTGHDLVELDVSGVNAVDLSAALPASLETLNLAGSQVETLPALPGLRSLDVSNTPITDLGPLRGAPRLEELTVHLGQIEDLGPGFSELHTLRVVPPSGAR